jgi:hypothetical protein
MPRKRGKLYSLLFSSFSFQGSTYKTSMLPGDETLRLMFLLRLCERAFRSRFTLREEGQVELWKWPNGLNASFILPVTDRHVNAVFATNRRQAGCKFDGDLLSSPML